MVIGLVSFLIPAAPLFGQNAFLVLFFAFFFSGFGRAFGFVPSLILNSHFDGAKKDK